MKNSIIKFRHSIIALIMIVLNGVGALASTPWTVNPSDYRYDMSLYLDVTFASAKMDYSQYEVAVFSGEQCRGIAEELPLGNGKECLYLRARSNQESGETMTFKYYNKETGKIEPIDGVAFTFESNGRLGYPSDPYIVGVYTYYDVELISGIGGSLDVNGGKVAEGTKLTITATPDTGYHFAKWSDGEVENPRTIIVNDNISLSAIFEVSRSFKLTYVVNGIIYKVVDVYEYSPIIPEPKPELEGYTFSGWEGLTDTMPPHDMTVNGNFTVNKYKLTIFLNDEVYSSEDVEFGTILNIEEPTVPEGKQFDGWTTEIPETMPAYDLDIYGIYSGSSSIGSKCIGNNEIISVYSLSGVLLHKDKNWSEIADKLENGIYIFNRQKVIVRK